MPSRLFWVWLAYVLGADCRDAKKVLQKHSPEEWYNALEDIIRKNDDLSSGTIEKLLKKSLDVPQRIVEKCAEKQICILAYDDERYPDSLRQIETPPIVLYALGNLGILQSQLKIGVVGARHMSSYGMRHNFRLSYDLALSGAVIVSGMAKGNDGVAAAACIEANGKTIAVLGSGVDVVYPSCHKPLYYSILQKGLLLSEYEPGAQPNSWHFPMRNRIISGLSDGLLVIEAAEKSGALLTAKHAEKQGKMLFALPQDLDNPGAMGTNRLLHEGAGLAMEANDILQQFPKVKEIFVSWNRAVPYDEASVIRLLQKYGVVEENQEEKQTKENADAKEEKSGSDSPVIHRVKKTKMPKTEITSAKIVNDITNGLTPMQKSILEAIPQDESVPLDAFSSLGYMVGDIISTLTILEIQGLVHVLPGGLYSRA